MPNDPILHLLGLARKAGRLEIGEEPVGAACRARQARLVLLASDAAANTNRRAAHFGEAGNVLWLELPFTKEELGFHLGRGSCAMLALTDAGFAASVTEKLAARDPERYGPAAQQLRQKGGPGSPAAEGETPARKNLQHGKKKPWAVPKSCPEKVRRPQWAVLSRRSGRSPPAPPETRSPRSGSPRPGLKHQARPRRPQAVRKVPA